VQHIHGLNRGLFKTQASEVSFYVNYITPSCFKVIPSKPDNPSGLPPILTVFVGLVHHWHLFFLKDDNLNHESNKRFEPRIEQTI